MRILFRSKLWRHPWSFCFPRLLTKGFVWKAGTICIQIHTYVFILAHAHAHTHKHTSTCIHKYKHAKRGLTKVAGAMPGIFLRSDFLVHKAQSPVHVCVCVRERESMHNVQIVICLSTCSDVPDFFFWFLFFEQSTFKSCMDAVDCHMTHNMRVGMCINSLSQRGSELGLVHLFSIKVSVQDIFWV